MFPRSAASIRQDVVRPAVLAGTREWSSRKPAGVPDSPERLAGRVEAALDRADRLLFTVTPREELDVAAQWQRMADQAWCGQLRHVVASTARMSAEERDFAGDELALALGLSPGAGRRLVWSFGAIAALPGLVEAVEAGRLTQRHVNACMQVLDETDLSLEQRQAVALIAIARYVDQTPSEWADVVRRLVLTVDPQAARRRRDGAADRRRADFFPRVDQQGAIWLQAPVELVAAAEARVSAEARRLKAAGDARTMEQLVCDVALDLLTNGILDGQPVAPFEVHVLTPLSVLEGDDTTLAELPGFGPLLPDTARGLAGQAGGFSQIVLDDDGHVTAMADRVPAETVRRSAGPGACSAAGDDTAGRASTADAADTDRSDVTADAADNAAAAGGADADVEVSAVADVVADAEVSGAHDEGGPPGPAVQRSAPTDAFLTAAVRAMRRPPVVRELASSGYRPSPRLTRFVQARDRTCVFPGCRRPAARTDLDHREPWPRGRTRADNLQCLCRHHHRAKHAIFTVLLDPDDGSTVWITRGGWVFRRQPVGL